MGIRRGSISTPIIVDGLVFHVDAANRASYPKTGVNWNDTVNGNNTTLTNDPIFNSGDIDFFHLDGSDDKIIGTNSTLLSFGNGSTDSPFSAFTWANVDNTSSSHPLIGKYRSYSPFRGEYNISVTTGGQVAAQLLDGATTIRCRNTTTSAISAGQWYNLGFTYNANGTDEGLKMYINGARAASSGFGQDGSYVAMQRASDPSELSIGVTLDEGNTQYQSNLDGKIANAQIYAKELSANEVLHNYNALKSRFGL